MKIEKITYSQSHETLSHSGLRTWYKFEAGGTVDQGENMEEAVATLKKFVQENVFPDLGMANEYMGGNHSDIPGHQMSVQQVEKEPKETAVGRIIKQINDSSSEVVLQSFKLLAKSNQQVQEAYDNKLKTFQ